MNWRSAALRRASALVAVFCSWTPCFAILTQGSSCEPGWVQTFGSPSTVSGSPSHFAVFDDGTGLALYLCGRMTVVGGEPVNGIARWNGLAWQAVPGTLGTTVRAIEVFDDGNGPALYAVGSFEAMGGVAASNVAKWDGQSWSPLAGGIDGPFGGLVRAMKVFPGPQGDELAFAGAFTQAGPLNVNNIASWNGTTWKRLGGGMNKEVFALEVHDEGSGPALYAGGKFDIAAPANAPGVARWDGTNWNAVGFGLNPGSLSEGVLALESFDDGSGPALFAGGDFTAIGNPSVQHLAKWSGSVWSAVGGGVTGIVDALRGHDDGSGVGRSLYVGGRFSNAGGLAAEGIARWDGALWSTVGNALPGELEEVVALERFDDGQSTKLFAVTRRDRNRVLSWDGNEWSSLTKGLDSPVAALHVHDDGTTRQLIAGGRFSAIGGAGAGGLAAWDGSDFSTLGSGVDGDVRTMETWDDGSGGGPALFVGGLFANAGGSAASNIARWNGSAWSALGAGIGGSVSASVEALAVWDDGTGFGERLYVGGRFSLAGNQPVSNLAVWDGSAWTPLLLPGEMTRSSSRVRSLAVHDDGSGDALYVGGTFNSVAGVQTVGIARWDGVSWSAVGIGFDSFSSIYDLEVHDAGAGPLLYAAGILELSSSPNPNPLLASWDGSQWNSEGTSLGNPFQAFSQALKSFDDGSGHALYLGGVFDGVDGVVAPGVARLRDSSWSSLGPGLQGTAFALEVFDADGATSLAVGGNFPLSPGGDGFLAAWQRCGQREDFCSGDGGTGGCTPCPCGNDAGSGTVGGCLNSVSRSARLLASGSNEVTTGDLRFVASGMTPTGFGMLVSGSGTLPGMGPCPSGSGIPSPVFDGLRCIGTGFMRHGTRSVDALGEIGGLTPGWGPPDGPVGGIAQEFGFSAGQTRFFQVIYRDDPAQVCGRGLNTTNGVRVLFQ